MKPTKTITVLLLLAALCIPLMTGCSGSKKPSETKTATESLNASEPIVFTDSVFETLLKTALGKEKITPADLSGYTGLQLMADKYIFLTGNGKEHQSVILLHEDTFEYKEQSYKGFGTVKSLADLKYFTDLHTLEVSLQPNIDYAAIPILGQIKRLTITQSSLKDIAFLSKSPGLLSLDLFENDVTDISALKSCASLMYLSVNYNDVSDLSPLKDLTSLLDISFYENKITDISMLSALKNLEEIEMPNNQIADISVLKGLTSLKTVSLGYNKITDVSPLKDFTSFERIILTGNPVKNIELLKHIDNLVFE